MRQLTCGMKTYSFPVIMLRNAEPSTSRSQVTQLEPEPEEHFEFPGGRRLRWGDRGRERDLEK